MNQKYMKLWTAMILITVLLVIPCALMPQILSYYDKPGTWLADTDFHKDDLLNFYASFFTFLGTIILGVATVFLSQQANDMNKRLIKIEENNYIPTIDINGIAPDELKDFALKDVFLISLNDSFTSIDEQMNLFTEEDEDVLVLSMSNVGRTDIISIEPSQLTIKIKYPGKESMVLPYENLTISLNNKVPYQSTIPFIIGGIPLNKAVSEMKESNDIKAKDNSEYPTIPEPASNGLGAAAGIESAVEAGPGVGEWPESGNTLINGAESATGPAVATEPAGYSGGETLQQADPAKDLPSQSQAKDLSSQRTVPMYAAKPYIGGELRPDDPHKKDGSINGSTETAQGKAAVAEVKIPSLGALANVEGATDATATYIERKSHVEYRIKTAAEMEAADELQPLPAAPAGDPAKEVYATKETYTVKERPPLNEWKTDPLSGTPGPILTLTLKFSSTNFLGERYEQKLKFDLISSWDSEINFPAVENKRNIMVYSC